MDDIMSTILGLLVLLGVIWGIVSLYNYSDRRIQIETFCKTVDGTYGGGKCFKDGVEMRMEESNANS